MPYKMTYIFRTFEEGWSESWYSGAEDVPIDSVHRVFKQTVVNRERLLGDFSWIQAVRTADLSGNRLVRLDNYVQPANNTKRHGDDLLPVETGFQEALVRIRGTGNSRRPMSCRGMPDDWIKYDASGQELIAAGFTDAMDAFVRAMSQGPFGWRLVDPSVTVNIPKPILAISFAAAPIQITATAHGFVAGQYVTITGLRGNNLQQRRIGGSNMNGTFRVQAVVDANVFAIDLIRGDFVADPVWLSGGTVRSRTPTFATAQSWEFVRYSTRATRAPFLGRRGHRRAVRSL